jgi:transaldolase
MALFLDSANIDDVRQTIRLGFVAGVTTNPALMAKTGRPARDVIQDILGLTPGPVFYQVTAGEAAARLEQARSMAALSSTRMVIKITATTENLALAAQLRNEGIACAITAVASPAQVYLASLAGATYAAVYVSRLTRQLGDGIQIVKECVAVARTSPIRVLAASLKSVEEVVAALLAGASDITIPLELILKLGEHEMSRKAIEEFAMYAEQPSAG